jgi:hypothetical protein
MDILRKTERNCSKPRIFFLLFFEADLQFKKSFIVAVAVLLRKPASANICSGGSLEDACGVGDFQYLSQCRSV